MKCCVQAQIYNTFDFFTYFDLTVHVLPFLVGDLSCTRLSVHLLQFVSVSCCTAIMCLSVCPSQAGMVSK